jgi:hypothetical protein
MSLFLTDILIHSYIISLCNDFINYQNTYNLHLKSQNDNFQQKSVIDNSELKIVCVFYKNIIYITEIDITIHNYPEKNLTTMLHKILYTIINNTPINTIIALYKVQNIVEICEILQNKINYNILRTSNKDLYNIIFTYQS